MRSSVVRSRWVLALGVCALLLALVVSGCSGGGGDSKIAEHVDEPAQVLTPSDAPEPVDQPTPVDSDTDGKTVSDVGAKKKAPCADAEGVDDSCSPRNVSDIDLFSSNPSSDGAHSEGPEATVEDVLEKGLLLAEASPVHLAVRGTADADSVRCDWRGIARTPEQRENAILFWLGPSEDNDVPEASYLKVLFELTHLNLKLQLADRGHTE